MLGRYFIRTEVAQFARGIMHAAGAIPSCIPTLNQHKSSLQAAPITVSLPNPFDSYSSPSVLILSNLEAPRCLANPGTS
jgi:hypothetical protein